MDVTYGSLWCFFDALWQWYFSFCQVWCCVDILKSDIDCNPKAKQQKKQHTNLSVVTCTFSWIAASPTWWEPSRKPAERKTVYLHDGGNNIIYIPWMSVDHFTPRSFCKTCCESGTNPAWRAWLVCYLHIQMVPNTGGNTGFNSSNGQRESRSQHGLPIPSVYPLGNFRF